MNRHLLITASIIGLIAISQTACVEQKYSCRCTVNGPDTGSVSLDYDTILTVTGAREEVANTECEAYEGASSVLIPDNAATQQFDVSCQLL